MNDIIKAMKERRSIRKFKQDMPTKEELDQIIEAGTYAANAMGKQKVITLVVTDKEVRDKLSEMNCKIGGWKEGFDPFYGAPVVMVVLAKKDWPFNVYDGSLVIGNMMLAAHSLGLGGIWVHRAKEEFESEECQKLLKDKGIEGEWEGVGHFVTGYIDGEVPEAAPRNENRVFYI